MAYLGGVSFRAASQQARTGTGRYAAFAASATKESNNSSWSQPRPVSSVDKQSLMGAFVNKGHSSHYRAPPPMFLSPPNDESKGSKDSKDGSSKDSALNLGTLSWATLMVAIANPNKDDIPWSDARTSQVVSSAVDDTDDWDRKIPMNTSPISTGSDFPSSVTSIASNDDDIVPFKPAPSRPQNSQDSLRWDFAYGANPPRYDESAVGSFSSVHKAAATTQETPVVSASTKSTPTKATTTKDDDLGRGVPVSSMPIDTLLCIVEFKAHRRDLFYIQDFTLDLVLGDLVMVEADRGRDTGRIVRFLTVDDLVRLRSETQRTPAPKSTIPRLSDVTAKRIFGKASAAEADMVAVKERNEARALQLVRSKVMQHGLAMYIYDAEWQWDKRKLTLFYSADHRVDFRDLVRELFRLYKARIWMCCIDQATPSWMM